MLSTLKYLLIYYIPLYFLLVLVTISIFISRQHLDSSDASFKNSIEILQENTSGFQLHLTHCGDVLLCKKIFLREHLLPKKGFSHSFFFLPIQFIYFAGVSLKNVVHTPSFEHLKMLSDILCSKAKILGQTRQEATREILHKMPLPSYIHITISLFVFNENVKGNAS